MSYIGPEQQTLNPDTGIPKPVVGNQATETSNHCDPSITLDLKGKQTATIRFNITTTWLTAMQAAIQDHAYYSLCLTIDANSRSCLSLSII